MSLRSLIYPPVANFVYHQYKKQSTNIVQEQEKQMFQLLEKAKYTEIGKRYNFNKIKSYDDYRKQVPLHQYSDLAGQIVRMGKGEANILWPGIPLHFAATSGTISGKKFIPITKEALKSQKMGRLTALANYSMKYGKLNQLKGPMLFFSARPSYLPFGKYQARLVSALMAQSIPGWLKKYNLPHDRIHDIEAFKERIAFMVKEALENRNDLRGIVAFPPWLHLFLNQMQEAVGIGFKELFPNFSLLVTSGMAFTPYAPMVADQMGTHFDHIETFPSSEGFISFTDTLGESGMSLMPANGLFYEFVKTVDLSKYKVERICLAETKPNVEYALVLTSNAGLWSYLLGDTIKFLSTNPWKLLITGRVGQTISLVAEHVSVADADACVLSVCNQNHLTLLEYVCSGVFSEHETKPRYEWIIECTTTPANTDQFAIQLHENMKKLNVLYEEVSEDGVMEVPKVYFVPPGSFLRYLDKTEELDAQQKMEHICKDYSKFTMYKKFMISNTIL